MRIVHIIESIVSPPAPTALRLVRDLIEADGEAEHRVLAIGPSALARSAERAGLPVAGAIAAPAGSWWRSAWALGWHGMGGLAPADVYHGWSLSGAALAARAAGAMVRAGRRAASVGLIPHAPIGAGGERRAIRRLTGRPTPLLVIDGSIREGLIRAGLSPGRVHVVHPGLAAGRRVGDDRAGEDRTALRLRWGVADETTRIVAAIGNRAERMDAMAALLGAGFAAEAGRRIRLLISPAAAGLERARRLARATRRERLLVIDGAADEPWRVLHGCDVALVLGGGLSVCWAMMAERPIVAVNGPGIAEHLTDGDNALLAGEASVGELAPRICRLHDEPGWAAGLGAAARRTAELRFDPARFVEQLRGFYRGAIEGRQDLAGAGAGPPAGGGLRGGPGVWGSGEAAAARRGAR